MAQDAHLPAAVPVLPQGPVQAAEVVPEIGSPAMSGYIQTHDGAARTGAQEAAGNVLLAANNLSVRFGGVLAVNNVSFEVKRGEVFTLIGPNGAGKTTVFNLISRIYQPT